MQLRELTVSKSPESKIHLSASRRGYNNRGSDLEASVVIKDGEALDVGRGRHVSGYVRLRYGRRHTENGPSAVHWFPVYGGTLRSNANVTAKVTEMTNAWALAEIVKYVDEMATSGKTLADLFSASLTSSALSSLEYEAKRHEREMADIKEKYRLEMAALGEELS